MRIIFLGAEDPFHYKFLEEMNVQNVGISFSSRLRKSAKSNSVLDYIPADVSIHLHPGSLDEMKPSQLEAFCDEYQDFISRHCERLTSWTEVYAQAPPGFHEQRRKDFYSRYDQACFRPFWRDNSSLFELEGLAHEYPNVVLGDTQVKATRTMDLDPLLGLASEYQTAFHCMGFHRPKSGQYHFHDVYSGIWLTPRKFGNTILWTGTKLLNRHRDQQEENREKFFGRIASYGLDTDKIMANDVDEVTRLAILSLLDYQDSVNRAPVTEELFNIPVDSGAGSAVIQPNDSHEHGGNLVSLPISPSAPINQRMNPVLGVDSMTSVTSDEDGQIISNIPVTTSPDSPVRKCDACAVSRQCPAYTPGELCSFSLPVELRSRDQIMAFTSTLLEMQASRVAFSRYAEELSGGMPTEDTSKEIDRFFRLLGQLKKLEESRDVARITVERQSSAGVLSAIFGDKAGQMLSPPEQPSE